MPNFNLGITLKPLPYASVYAAYATSANPVGAEFDGTSTAYGGVAPVLANSPNQIFGPEKNQAIELGTKWELFNRHLLLTGALFQTNKENAREAYNVNRAATANTEAVMRPNPIDRIRLCIPSPRVGPAVHAFGHAVHVCKFIPGFRHARSVLSAYSQALAGSQRAS